MAAASSSNPSAVKAKDLSGLDVAELFDAIDLNGDGVVSFAEFNVLLARLGVALKPADARALFEAADKDSSGEIDIDELEAFLTSTPVASSATGAARAVRAGLIAQYYAAAAAKALRQLPDGVGTTARDSLALNLAVNGGCSDEEVQTTIRLTAGDLSSSLPDAVQDLTAGVVIDVDIAEGHTAASLVEAWTEAFGDISEASRPRMIVMTSDDGTEYVRFVVDGASVLEKLKTGIPIPMGVFLAGFTAAVTLQFKQSVTELLFAVPTLVSAPAQLKAEVSLSEAVGHAIRLGGRGELPWELLAFGESSPTSISISTGLAVRDLVRQRLAKRSDSVSEEEVDGLLEKVETHDKVSSLARVLRAAQSATDSEGGASEGEADPDGTSDPDSAEESESRHIQVIAKHMRPLVHPIGGIRGIYGRLASLGFTASVDTTAFSFSKAPTASA